MEASRFKNEGGISARPGERLHNHSPLPERPLSAADDYRHPPPCSTFRCLAPFQLSDFPLSASPRAFSPRGQQRQKVFRVRIAIAIDITVRRPPRPEQEQEVGGVDIAIPIEIRLAAGA